MAIGLQALGSTQVGQVNDECKLDDATTQCLHQQTRGFGSTTGGDQVIDDEHPFALRDRVHVQLDVIGAVFQFVCLGNRRAR